MTASDASFGLLSKRFLHEHLWLIGYRHRIGGVHVERSDRALDLFRELRYTGTGRETDQFAVQV
jgi:hypothetical protein